MKTFDELYCKTDTCWLWTGPVDGAGYGKYRETNKLEGAHRIAFRRANPDIDITNLIVRHSCNTPLCVNPAHLLHGTQLDNMRDRSLSGRGFIPSGVANGRALVTPGLVLQIREAAKCNTVTAVAKLFNLKYSCCYAICAYITWRNVK